MFRRLTVIVLVLSLVSVPVSAYGERSEWSRWSGQPDVGREALEREIQNRIWEAVHAFDDYGRAEYADEEGVSACKDYITTYGEERLNVFIALLERAFYEKLRANPYYDHRPRALVSHNALYCSFLMRIAQRAREEVEGFKQGVIRRGRKTEIQDRLRNALLQRSKSPSRAEEEAVSACKDCIKVYGRKALKESIEQALSWVDRRLDANRDLYGQPVLKARWLQYDCDFLEKAAKQAQEKIESESLEE